MGKLPQILQLTPSSEIIFQGPFEHVVTSYLEIKNPSDTQVCFKVKTTAPRRYCVRPNSGVIDPDGKVRIAIMLQPIERESQDERAKHKFMVQSTVIQNANLSAEEIWQKAQSKDIMDSKLRCVFHDNINTNEQTNAKSADLQQQDTTQQSMTTDTAPSAATNKQAAATTASSNFSTTATSAQKAWPASEKVEGGRGKENISSSASSSSPTVAPTVARVSSSTTKSWASGDAAPSSQYLRRSDIYEQQQGAADKSIASSHNLTASSIQEMSDDYKIALVSLIMLVLGVILGKYII